MPPRPVAEQEDCGASGTTCQTAFRSRHGTFERYKLLSAGTFNRVLTRLSKPAVTPGVNGVVAPVPFEQIRHAAHQVSEQIARSGYCRDVQDNRLIRQRPSAERHDEAQQVEVDWAEHEVEHRTCRRRG